MDAGNTIPSLAAGAINAPQLQPFVSPFPWYAAYTAANHEKKIAAELNRRSIECYLPLYSCLRRWKDRRVQLEMPLFPGYIFVRFAVQERLRVLQIPGVVRLVGFRDGAVPVPEEDIARIRVILGQRYRAEPHPYLTAGRRVRVRSGPLGGVEGIIVRRKSNTRFVLSVALIQRSVGVEIDGLELEPLGHPR